MVKKNFLKSSLVIAIAVVMMLPIIPTISLAATSDKPSITYSAHMQTYGWDKTNQKPGEALNNEAKNFAGVTGQSKRMEALEVNVAGAKLEYRAHVQGEGWMDWVAADDVANHKATVGTTGRSLRVEALQLSVKGLKGYSILYRAHVQGEGWMDWVDAADPTAYAGTEGRSLRMEAFEIVVVPENEFYYLNNNDGTHTQYYKGTLSNPEKCVYGDYTADGDKMVRKCALCEYSNGETVSLNNVLTEAKLDGQSKVSLENVKLSEKLTIPEGMTLEVAENFDTDGKQVQVNGNLVTKSTSGVSNLKFGENGTLTYKGVYTNQGDLAACLGVATNTAINLDKIVFEKGSEAQTISNTITLPKERELVLDLNNTQVTLSATNDAITNNGKLTINDGSFTLDGSSTGIRSYGENSELVVNNCTITGKGNVARAISIGEGQNHNAKGQVATITDTKITLPGTNKWGVAVFSDDTVINMKNVTLDTESGALYTNATFKNITFVGENVTVTSDSTAVYFGAAGTYRFNNSNITGAEGIEYTRGKLTLSNTKVVANRTPDTHKLNNDIVSGKGTFSFVRDGYGSYGFGAGVQLKQLVGTDKTELELLGNSKVESAHGPAILVFTAQNAIETERVKLGYPTDSVKGYTADTTNYGPVVWANYKASISI